jgi:hypothetical protein
MAALDAEKFLARLEFEKEPATEAAE